MKKMTGFLAVLIMLMWANTIRADANGLVNGSFEYDTWIGDISAKEPNGWDVNMPTGNFGGYVSNGWSTEGNFSLTLYSISYTEFEANDMIEVYQQVPLKDIEHIFFDIKLDTDPSSKIWDPNKRTAAVLIDGEIVWVSDIFGGDVKGVHAGQVDININDDALHKLSLALISDVAEEDWLKVDTEYDAYWDNIRFELICGGNGFPTCDFNKDCRVDANDYAMLVDRWLEEVEPNSIYNLSNEGDFEGYGIINFNDFAIWADGLETIDYEELESFTDLWLSEVPYEDEWNLYKGDDVPSYGIVDFADHAVFAEHWLESSLP
jgi:hypothetical protein